MNSHGYFSPSQLSLRAYCPGSANLQKENEAVAPMGGDTAESTAGTIKHEMAVLLRNKQVEPDAITITDDVRYCVQQVEEILAQLPADAIVTDEYRIDLSDLGIDGGAEGCRVDLLAVVPGRYAVVVDYKFGEMWTDSPEWNWQMKGYAAGVMRSFGVPEVQAVILQPNIDEGNRRRAHTFDAAAIAEAETGIKSIVEAAKAPTAPLIRGDHCGDRFCCCRPVCPLWRDSWLSVPQNTTVEAYMTTLPPDGRRKLYENLLAANKFTEIAIEAVKALAVAGKLEIAGYVVGDGKKQRWWESESSAREKLSAMIVQKGRKIEEVIKPISPAQAEKIFGKEELKSMICEKFGSPILKKTK